MPEQCTLTLAETLTSGHFFGSFTFFLCQITNSFLYLLHYDHFVFSISRKKIKWYQLIRKKSAHYIVAAPIPKHVFFAPLIIIGNKKLACGARRNNKKIMLTWPNYFFFMTILTSKKNYHRMCAHILYTKCGCTKRIYILSARYHHPKKNLVGNYSSIKMYIISVLAPQNV